MPVMRASVAQMKYAARLDAAWQQHLAPRAIDAPTVISTFAGCGGSSLGYSMAGYRELLAVEWDDHAVATFQTNFPDVPMYHGDIAALTVADVFLRTGLHAGELDVFDGSPPCQGFSTSGVRAFDDSRNQLFREYVRLLRGLQPKVFVMENVAGMVQGKMKLIFAEILAELKASGYAVSARLLNAMYFHVPQSRARMIFIGVRNDLARTPTHPMAQSPPMTPRTAWDALEQVPDDQLPYCSPWLQEAAKYIDAGNYSETSAVAAFQRVKGKTSGALSTKLLSWDRVSCTLMKSEHAETGIIHPNRQRYLTTPELKRISSFPDAYVLEGKRKDIVARLGNSVPPMFMRAIAQHIRTHILAPIEVQP